MSEKQIKTCFKIWARCNIKTRYMYQFQVNTEKGDSVDNKGLGHNVMNLCNEVSEKMLVALDHF